jgi:hypothetical protein
MVENFVRDFFGLTIYRVTRSHDMGHEFQILARFDFDLFLGSFFFQFHESILYHQAFKFVSFVDFFFSRGYSNLISQVMVGRVDSIFFLYFF